MKIFLDNKFTILLENNDYWVENFLFSFPNLIRIIPGIFSLLFPIYDKFLVRSIFPHLEFVHYVWTRFESFWSLNINNWILLQSAENSRLVEVCHNNEKMRSQLAILESERWIIHFSFIVDYCSFLILLFIILFLATVFYFYNCLGLAHFKIRPPNLSLKRFFSISISM